MSHYKKLDDLTRFPPNRAEIAPKRDHQRFQKPTIVLDGALIFLLFRHIMFGWALYEVFGRFFVFLPSALWLCLTLIFIHVASKGYWFTEKFQKRPMLVSLVVSCIWFIIDLVLSIAFLVFIGKFLKEFIFEEAPISRPGQGWKWLWNIFIVMVVFSTFHMAILLTRLVLSIIHIIYSKKNSDKNWDDSESESTHTYGATHHESNHNRVSSRHIHKYICCGLSALFLIIGFIMLFMGLVSAVRLSGKFGRPSVSDFSSCDPIDPTMCAYPWPSSFYLESDPSTDTGLRVNLKSKSLPRTITGSHIDPLYWNELDGFSTISPILFYLNDATNVSFIPHTNISMYLDQNVSTVLLEYNTLARVPHWTELDAVDAKYPSIIIQPAVPLKHGTRYIVGIRNIYRKNSNPLQKIEPTLAFKGLINETGPTNGAPLQRWEMYRDQILPKLFADGFTRDELQLAWDFTTISRKSSLGHFETMRDITLDYQPKADIIDDQQYHCTKSGVTIGRSLTFKLDVPYYLKPSSKRGTMLPRNNNGRVIEPIKQQATKDVYVIVRIPCSIILDDSGQAATHVVQYGHGLFGSRTEVESDWIGKYLNDTKMIFFASDWYGMSNMDQLTIMKVILSDPKSFIKIPEMTLQGWINKMIVLKSFQSGALAQWLEVEFGRPLVNATKDIRYYGISQGGVIGGGYVASSPYLEKAVLGVPGSPFALLLSRSNDFNLFKSIFYLNFYTWRDIRFTLSLMQQLWDQGESGGWLSYMNQETPSNIPKKQILIQDAWGDAQVTILGARLMARAYNATNLSPSLAPIWGLNENSTTQDSAIVEWAYENVPPDPFENVPPMEKYDTHECVRLEPEAQQQIVEFFETGIIRQTCNGLCKKPKCPS